MLLKNEQNALPLEKGAKVAFFGRVQQETVISGQTLQDFGDGQMAEMAL